MHLLWVVVNDNNRTTANNVVKRCEFFFQVLVFQCTNSKSLSFLHIIALGPRVKLTTSTTTKKKNNTFACNSKAMNKMVMVRIAIVGNLSLWTCDDAFFVFLTHRDRKANSTNDNCMSHLHNFSYFFLIFFCFFSNVTLKNNKMQISRNESPALVRLCVSLFWIFIL